MLSAHFQRYQRMSALSGLEHAPCHASVCMPSPLPAGQVEHEAIGTWQAIDCRVAVMQCAILSCLLLASAAGILGAEVKAASEFGAPSGKNCC